MVKVFVFLFAMVLALTAVALDYSLAAKTHGGAYDFSDHFAARVASARGLVGLSPSTDAPSGSPATSDKAVAVAAVSADEGNTNAPTGPVTAAAASAPAQGSSLANLVIGGIVAGARAAASTDKVLSLAEGVRLALPTAVTSVGLVQDAAQAPVTTDVAAGVMADVVTSGDATQGEDDLAMEGLSAAPSEGLPDDAATEAALGLAQQPVAAAAGSDAAPASDTAASSDASAGSDAGAQAPTVTADASGSRMIKPVSRLANAVCVMRAGVRDCGKGN